LKTLHFHIISAVISLAGLCLGPCLQAQTSATATVNLILQDVIAIDNGSTASGDVLNFTYETAADYNTAKTLARPAALVVTSTRNFEIKVKAAGAAFQNGQNSIPVSILQIQAVPGGSLQGQQKKITLSATDQVLVAEAQPGAAKTLNLEYSIPAARAQAELLGKPAGTYTQTVTYTAVAL